MKKQIAAIMSAVMMAGLLGGCGGGNKAAPETTKAAETTKAEESAKTEESAKGEEGTKETESGAKQADPGDIESWILEDDTNMSGTVRFWMPFKGDAGMDDMIAEFNKVYPNIKVELTSYSNNSDGNMSVNTAIMSGEIDVLGSFGLNNTYKRWSNDLFMDLTDKVTEEGISLTDNWSTDVYTYNDRIYTFPCGGLSYYVCINMTAWEEAGLGEIPKEWTWDEYLEASRKMTKKDGENVLVYGGTDYHSVDYFTYPKQQVYGTDRYYDDETGLACFDSDLIINSLKREINAENVEKIWYPKTIYRSDSIQTQQTYMSGEAASAVNPNMIRFIRDRENYPADFKTAFAPFPVEEKGQTNYMSGVAIFSHAGITQGCKDEAAAWAFLKWYSTYGSKYLVIAGHQSTWRGTAADDLVSLIFGSEAEAAELIDVESFKRIVGVPTNPTFVETQMAAYADVTNAINEYAMYAFNGEMTPEEAMKEAAEVANEAIKKEQR